MANLFTKLYDVANASLDKRLNDLQKNESAEDLQKREELLEKKQKEDGIGRKGAIFDVFQENSNSQGLFKPKNGFITNSLLKQVSRRAPAVSTIIHTRCSQVAAFCKPQVDRFATGFSLTPKQNVEPVQEEIDELNEFISNCGIKENRSHEDKMTFDQFGYAVVADMLKYGNATIERVPRNDKGLYAFLPLAAESIFYSNNKADKNAILAQRNLWQESLRDPNFTKESNVSSEDIEFVQVIDGKVVEEFDRHELVFVKLSTENDIDLQGYCVGPLERALSMVTAQLQVENHQRGQFTHGIASRGILAIQGDMTPNQLRALQSQWTQQVTGPLNVWRTPILAGIKGIQWVPLTSANRDMEYAAYQDHILRTIHACFQIDPEETGFGYLSKGTEQRTMGESSNEYKIMASQSKGLVPILTRLESFMNEEILPSYNQELSDKYTFCFVGLDAETRTEEIERLSGEVALHTSLNEARTEADLEPLPVGGNLILNPLLLQTLQTNMYKGQFMELFMGIEGASQNPDLQYIPDPLWFQFQQMQMQLMQQQAGGVTQGGQPQDPNTQQPGGPQEEQEQGSQQPGQQDQQAQAMQQQQMEMQQQQQQAQAMAAQRFMEANPHLFKSMRNNLLAARVEDLTKASTGRPNDRHVETLYNKLMKDYNEASEKMLKEVMSAVKDDLGDEHDHDCKEHDCKTDDIDEDEAGDNN